MSRCSSAHCGCVSCASGGSTSGLAGVQVRATRRGRSPFAVNTRGFAAYASPGTVDYLRRFRTGLGSLGDSTVTPAGQIISKGIGTAAGLAATAGITAAVSAIGGAAAGAAGGSVIPVVGTIIGAAIGYLTGKLFGHADYAEVYANIENVMALFEAYQPIAGEYPGRIFGWPEMQYVFHGAMVFGLWPGNGPAITGDCTQAMITAKINACGTGQFVDDLIGAGAPNPGSGSNNIVNLVGTALVAGLRNPQTIVSQYVIPGLTKVAQGKGNAWLNPATSGDPQLYQQMLIDLTDIIVTTKYPQTPVYYGSIPPDYTGSVDTTMATATAAPGATKATGANNLPAAPAQSTVSPAGTQITAGSGKTISTSTGWVFGFTTTKGNGGYQVYVTTPGQIAAGGAATPINAYGVGMTLQSSQVVILTDSNNDTYTWSPSAGTFVANSASAATANSTSTNAALSPAGTTITPASGGSLVSPFGTFTFGTTSDGNGNYQILLNGSYTAAGSSNGTQLQMNSSGVVVATISNGATYGFSSGGWTSITAPSSVTAISTPTTISANGATIIPGSTTSLVTAQGEWTFSTQTDGTGNYYLLLNGSLAGSETGIQLSISNGIPTLMRTDGSTWAWNGTAWAQQTAATSLTAVTTSYDDTGGDYSDGGYSDYSGYTDTTAAAAPAATPTTGMSETEKVLIWGGAAIALLSLTFALSRKGR
jgi:hypothetical protein